MDVKKVRLRCGYSIRTEVPVGMGMVDVRTSTLPDKEVSLLLRMPQEDEEVLVAKCPRCGGGVEFRTVSASARLARTRSMAKGAVLPVLVVLTLALTLSYVSLMPHNGEQPSTETARTVPFVAMGVAAVGVLVLVVCGLFSYRSMLRNPTGHVTVVRAAMGHKMLSQKDVELSSIPSSQRLELRLSGFAPSEP